MLPKRQVTGPPGGYISAWSGILRAFVAVKSVSNKDGPRDFHQLKGEVKVVLTSSSLGREQHRGKFTEL